MGFDLLNYRETESTAAEREDNCVGKVYAGRRLLDTAPNTPSKKLSLAPKQSYVFFEVSGQKLKISTVAEG
jgi:hypothetical protein